MLCQYYFERHVRDDFSFKSQDMAVANIRALFDACPVNDVTAVKRALPQVPIRELNSLDIDGQISLHDRVQDEKNRTLTDVASGKEVVDPPEPQVFQRCAFNEIQNQRINWLFGRDKAEAFSRAIHRGCITNRGIRKTVEKIEKAQIIPTNDESKEGKTLRYYLNQAREQNDATYLVRMYTIDGIFYRTINDYMAEGKSKEVFEKLRGKWSGYYVGCVMKDSGLFPYRFAGITYRGMAIDHESFSRYQCGTVVTNKTLQSSSKLPDVALRFSRVDLPTLGKVSVLIQHIIVDPKSALNIRNLSEFPGEEEVLMLPGILFMTEYVNKDTKPFQVHLRQLPWTNE